MAAPHRSCVYLGLAVAVPCPGGVALSQLCVGTVSATLGWCKLRASGKEQVPC